MSGQRTADIDWRFWNGVLRVLLIAGVVFFTVDMVYSFVGDFADRFIMTSTMEDRFLRWTAIMLVPFAIAGACYCVANWKSTRPSVIKTAAKFFYSLVLISVALGFVWGFAGECEKAVCFAVARQPAIFESVVLDSYRYTVYRSGTVHRIAIKMPFGWTGTVRTDADFFSRHFHHTVLVNGTCALRDLRQDLPLIVHARVSRFGYAIDQVTSPQTCNTPRDLP